MICLLWSFSFSHLWSQLLPRSKNRTRSIFYVRLLLTTRDADMMWRDLQSHDRLPVNAAYSCFDVDQLRKYNQNRDRERSFSCRVLWSLKNIFVTFNFSVESGFFLLFIYFFCTLSSLVTPYSTLFEKRWERKFFSCGVFSIYCYSMKQKGDAM